MTYISEQCAVVSIANTFAHMLELYGQLRHMSLAQILLQYYGAQLNVRGRNFLHLLFIWQCFLENFAQGPSSLEPQLRLSED